MNFPICSGLVVVDTFYTKVTGLRQFGTVNSTERPPQAKIFRNYNVFGKKGPSYKQLHSQWQCNCNAFTRIWNKHATRQPQLTNNKWCMWLSSLSPPSLSLSRPPAWRPVNSLRAQILTNQCAVFLSRDTACPISSQHVLAPPVCLSYTIYGVLYHSNCKQCLWKPVKVHWLLAFWSARGWSNRSSAAS